MDAVIRLSEFFRTKYKSELLQIKLQMQSGQHPADRWKTRVDESEAPAQSSWSMKILSMMMGMLR
jgi:hypothetical protein